MKEHSVLEINVWNAKESGPLIKHLLSANMSLVLSGKLDQRASNKLPCQEMRVIQVSLVHSPWLEIFEKMLLTWLFTPVSLMIVILFLSSFGS